MTHQIKDFPLNTKGRDFFVGDIHGHLELIERGLNDLNFSTKTDRVFATGDLIDRGPKSLECLKLLDKPWFFSVIGNHELMLIENLKGGTIERSIENHWQSDLSNPERKLCIDLVSRMYSALTIDLADKKVGVVHAGVPPHMSWKQLINNLKNNDQKLLTYITNTRKIRITDEDVKGIDQIIVGHQGKGCVESYGNITCIDTCSYVPRKYGAGHGLTFCYFEDAQAKFHTVSI